jgi:NADH-quinone oxidoreductase subunit C
MADVVDENLVELSDHIAAGLGDAVLERVIAHGELTLRVEPARIVAVIRYLRSDTTCQFHNLTDICGADYPDRPERFEVVYHLLSLTNNQRVRVKLRAGEGAPVPSIIEVFPSANWFEREAYDLYGITFSGHPDLRRMLTDYGFDGHPLRKDFPLTGFVEVRYDDEARRVVYEPVRLTQEFRSFDFMSPWEGVDYVLPGDEKADEGGDKP